MRSQHADTRPGSGRWAVAGLLACALLAGALLAGACGQPRPTHPNIVVLLADDLGFGDVAWTQSRAADPIPTPHLEQLAREGVVLDQFRTAALCSPARASILTGKSAVRLGLLRNIGAKDVGGLDTRVTTLPLVLAAAGYATELIGKWHLGHARAELRPTQRGFDHFLGLLGGWIDYQTHARGPNADWWRDDEPLVQTGHSTRLLADEAVRAIRDRDRSKPFFLHVAFNAPHAPTSVPPGRSLDEMPFPDPVRRAYALLVDELDRAVGRVLAALDEEGLRDDTIVVFASDNGAPLAYGGSNGPLRGEKGTVFEGGLHVPAIVAWRDVLTPKRSDVVVNAVDLVPTLCDAAGVALPADPERDGVSVWPALHGDEVLAPRTAIFGVHRADGTSYAALDGRWKLVHVAGASAPDLFDVSADPRETRDVSAEQPEVTERLSRELAPWRALETGVFVPDLGPENEN